MGIDDPAARLAVRGLGVVALGPGGEVRGRIAVPVRRKTTTATAEGSLRQSDRLAQRPALRAGLGGCEPAIAGDQFGAQPRCLVAELAAKLRPGGITDCAGEMLVACEVGDGEVLDGQLGVGLDKLARDLVKEASPQVSNASMLLGQASAGLVIVDSDRAEGWQGHRAGVAFADSDAEAASSALSIAQPKAVAATSLTLESREAGLATFALAVLRLGVGGKGPAEVDGSLLEHLCGDPLLPGQPVTCLVTVPSRATTKTRPASSVLFQALNGLMRSNPDQGTGTDGSSLLAARASVTSRSDWLWANRDAPAWRERACCWTSVGSKAKRKVVCRIGAGSVPRVWDRSAGTQTTGRDRGGSLSHQLQQFANLCGRRSGEPA
jgi:hypothetical protein